MNDFYENPYVESSWTRFVFFWQLFGFEKRRSDAFVAWAKNTVDRLRLVYKQQVTYVLNQETKMDAPISDVAITLPAVLPDFAASVTWNHYDSWTKAKQDPAGRVIEWIGGKAYLEQRKAA